MDLLCSQVIIAVNRGNACTTEGRKLHYGKLIDLAVDPGIGDKLINVSTYCVTLEDPQTQHQTMIRPCIVKEKEQLQVGKDH